ncbi:hypothetical protein HF086_004309 [Spodoptera exigua]|uniref:RRM domain-containing protein n=1 Tax=Spodoptera exigua TaxID=7107 RepID=A0A922MW31_SPOEX|nr:hypothetical protein HF086_004309 [Spodoptera exigua]
MVVLMSNQVFRSGYFVLTSNKCEKREEIRHGLAEIEKRQGGPLPSLGERPALAQLITATDVDEAAEEEEEEEDAAEPSSDKSAPADSAANGDGEPADDQHQVNSEAPATSNEDEKHEKEIKEEKGKEADGEKKEKKEENKEGGARNLWVSGLSGDTRAKDLKQLCSKHGKVIGAKVVTNARTPGSRCYGYVTMASAQDAENCIKNLHRTELHGRMISVEKAKSESESASRRQPTARSERRPSKERKEEAKENEDNKEGIEKSGEIKVKKESEMSGAESTRSTSRTREKSHRSDKVTRNCIYYKYHFKKSRIVQSGAQEAESVGGRLGRFCLFPKFGVVMYGTEGARRGACPREVARGAEEERRRRAAEDALRERERRQRQEKHRLALEREKLRAEREKIEREKNELLRLERERHRLEREKLELERLELKRAQLRYDFVSILNIIGWKRNVAKRGYEGGAYRKAGSPPPEPAYERDTRHKRPPPPPISSSRGQFEAPPPPRFEMTASYDRGTDKRDRERDYKRDYPRHVSSSNMKYSSNGGASEDSRQPMPPGTRPKEPSRSYESRDNRSYRPSPPGKPEPRSWNASSRYPDAAPPSKGSNGSGGGGEAWSSGEARYGSYEARYAPQYQPPPPGAPYPDRYAPPPRDYPRKY